LLREQHGCDSGRQFTSAASILLGSSDLVIDEDTVLMASFLPIAEDSAQAFVAGRADEIRGGIQSALETVTVRNIARNSRRVAEPQHSRPTDRCDPDDQTDRSDETMRLSQRE
jgi:hypothetical protein